MLFASSACSSRSQTPPRSLLPVDDDSHELRDKSRLPHDVGFLSSCNAGCSAEKALARGDFRGPGSRSFDVRVHATTRGCVDADMAPLWLRVRVDGEILFLVALGF